MKFNKHIKVSLVALFILVVVFYSFGSGIFQESVKEASAAATFISSAKNNSRSSGTTLALTVPAGGWPAGSSVLLTVTFDVLCHGSGFNQYMTDISAINDTAGNVYTRDSSNSNGNGPIVNGCYNDPATIAVNVWSVHNINALSAGNTITITFNGSIVAKAAVAANFTGLATTGTYDKSWGRCGPSSIPNCTGTSNTAADTGNTPTTTQAHELLIGVIGVEGPSGDTFTSDSRYGLLDRDGSSGGSANSNVTTNLEYRIVNAVGNYNATGTLGTGRNWIGIIASYKIAGPPPTIAFVSSAKNSSKTSSNTLTLTVPAGGWSAGSSVIVSFSHDTQIIDISCAESWVAITDSAGNNYSPDTTYNNNSSQLNCNATFSSSIWSAHNIKALAAGDIVTINFPTNLVAKAAVAANFTGLSPVGALDQDRGHCGPGSDPIDSVNRCSGASTDTYATSFFPQTTTQADELLIGVIGPEGPISDNFTSDINFALIDRAGTSGNPAAGNITNALEYRIVSSTGSYLATGTLGTGRNWMALIATYKATKVPIVVSPTATSITGTTATLGANITFGGSSAITARGTCWGTTPNPVTNCLAEGGTSTGVFTQSRTGLPISTHIYYRGYATNADGTSYSVDGEFDTLAANPALNQNHYRFRDDSAALNVDGGYLAVEDNAYTSLTAGNAVRLRMELANTEVYSATNYRYQLEYARKVNSTCGTFSPVPTSPGSVFQMVDSTRYANNDPVNAGLLTNPGLAFSSGYGIENTSNITPIHTLSGNNYTELEYAFKIVPSSSAGGPYCFRVTNSGSTTNFTYSVYPELNVSWYTNWTKYQPILVTNSTSSTLTDFEVQLPLNTQSMISAGDLQSQCQDLRFVGTDNIKRLGYFLETADCNVASTPVWVRVPSIPASGSTTIYMYYKNPNASSESSGDETFAFFDNFENGILNSSKWSVSGPQLEEFDTTQKRYGTYSLKIALYPTVLSSANLPTSVATKGVFEAFTRYNETGRYHYAFNLVLNTGVELYSTVASLTYWAHFNLPAGWVNYSPLTTYSPGTWYLVAQKYNFADTTANPNGTYWPVINGTQLSATGLLDYNSNPGTSAIRWNMFQDSGGGAFWVDDVRVRQYASTEPTAALLNIPVVTSPTSANVTNTTATLGANITSNGGSALTARGTCWDTTPSPTTNCLAEGGTSTGVFTQARTGLPQGTMIYYRGYAVNSSGTGYSPDGTFTTSGSSAVPTLISPTVSSITNTTATLGVNVSSDGGESITARGTCWDTTPNPTTNCIAEGGTTTGVFTHARTGLPSGTLIYYRGYAINSVGTGYSPDGTFTTLALPTVTSPTATSINSNGATLGANVTSDGGTSLISRGTCWGTSPNPTSNCLAQGGTTTGVFTHVRTGMSTSTLIYYRGYATNSVGTAYSADGTFNTSSSSAMGTLTSIVFDTGVAGPAYNAILWKGTLPVGTKVRFRLAASTNALGPWNDSDFVGSDGASCGSSYWYEPSGPDTPLKLGCPSNLNGKRYFKYKVQLCSSTDCVTPGTETPVITDIILNWSP